MKKITIIYWSGTGNTELMADAIAVGSKDENIEVILKEISAATKEDIRRSDLIAFGSSAMGSESVEDDMSSYIDSNKIEIEGKAVVLFGSYDWGSGDWIEDWEKDMKQYGSNVIEGHLKINLTPDEEGLKKCESYGQLLKTYVLK